MKKKKKPNITIGDLLMMEAEYHKNHRASVWNTNNTILEYWYGIVFAQRHISIQYKRNLTTDLKHKLSQWKLTKFEMLMLLCYLGDLSEVFDNGDPNTSPYPINEMCKAMDSVLIKAPVCTETSILYRQCRHDKVDGWKKDMIVTIPHYITTSIKNTNQPNNQLIITPKEIFTNARSLYIMRNDKEEYQVTFKRGTTFLIENVLPFEMDGIEYKRIWMKEL
ncbi:MAG: hypothetical protein IKH80_08325 [Bacteroidaceae bacterium]|nr:hypothetical protein [Bacteroidaceae bacterium]